MEGQEPGWPPLMHSCPPLQGLAEYRRLRFAFHVSPGIGVLFAFLDRLGRVEVLSESSQLKTFPVCHAPLLPHHMRRVTHHRAHSRHPDKFITPLSHPPPLSLPRITRIVPIVPHSLTVPSRCFVLARFLGLRCCMVLPIDSVFMVSIDVEVCNLAPCCSKPNGIECVAA